MWRLIMVLLALAALVALAFLAYAYLGPIFLADDFTPPVREVREPVDLDLD